MPTVDEILASSPLAGLRRVSRGGGEREVTVVRLAERFAELDQAPPTSLIVLSRAASAEVTDYRLDMALRWGAIHRISAVAAFAADRWRPTVTVTDIAGRADIALIHLPQETDLTDLVRRIMREIGGGAEQALGRAEQGLAAVLQAEQAGADIDGFCTAVSQALGIAVEFHSVLPGGGSPSANGDGGDRVGVARGGGGGAVNGPGADMVSVPVVAGEAAIGYFVAPDAHGDSGIGARLVLHAAASAAGRLLDLARRARELPARSRSELLAELLMSEAAINEDLLDRARQLAIPVGGWHVAVRIEADDLEAADRDEVQRFELLDAVGQAALQAVAATGGTWYLSRIGRAIVLIRVTSSNPGPQAGARAARSAERALEAIGARFPALRFRAGVGSPHEGPMGLRASATEARSALAAARAARRPAGVAAHDAVGVQRMLMEWYSSDTARASVREQLAPLEKLGPGRAETAIQTLAVYLDEQGSLVKTAQRLHLHRNAVANRLRGITELLEIDLEDPDQRLVLQLACRARLLG
jgi:sugar diacid utilization regulator